MEFLGTTADTPPPLTRPAANGESPQYWVFKTPGFQNAPLTLMQMGLTKLAPWSTNSCMKRFDANISKLVGQIATISAGYPFRGKIDELPDGDVAVIQMRNTDAAAGIDWPGLSRVELPRVSAKAFLNKGDVILSTRGGRNIAYCIGERQEQVVCSPHFFVIRTKRQSVLPEFLAWQLNQKPAQGHFTAGATGSYILNLKREVVEQLPIVIPSLAEQQRIVELSAAARTERAILNQLIENRSLEMDAIAKRLLETSSTLNTSRLS
ncbi:hypothetical protein FHW96_002163 [Novosphingobium sp. SG751A]|uniref:restriction endonuclease subunit S n=1 Tax=Novosphingobium sp. SG751A TaxID=2587000 RepID=UPI001556C099|nr:restriction endonuclease subunit S [Novosphingobium sp. SG751A]NOW46005.1 hypothetical protein [Novosphingobium sp. SG751A]